jgi:hypothetical protein
MVLDTGEEKTYETVMYDLVLQQHRRGHLGMLLVVVLNEVLVANSFLLLHHHRDLDHLAEAGSARVASFEDHDGRGWEGKARSRGVHRSGRSDPDPTHRSGLGAADFSGLEKRLTMRLPISQPPTSGVLVDSPLSAHFCSASLLDLVAVRFAIRSSSPPPFLLVSALACHSSPSNMATIV